MSPIYVRPEREQAEHDRLIRFLQAEYSRKFEAVANPGDERIAPVKIAATTYFPDVVLNQAGRLAGVIEVETAASVNNLETMAKWVPFSRARVPFHLYVPVPGYEAAMRLVDAHGVKAAEIWTYRVAHEGFDLVRMFVDESAAARAAAARSAAKAPAKVQAKAPARPAATPPARAATKAPARSAAAKAQPAARKTVKKSAPATAKTRAQAKPAAARKAAPARGATASRAKTTKPAAKSRPVKKGTGARKSR